MEQIFKTPEEILEENCGTDYSPYTGCIHGMVYRVLNAMEEYGKQQYNQALTDLIDDDLLPDKERNLKKYMK